MEQKYLAKWLKVITLITGVIGLVVFFLILPVLGMDMVSKNASLENLYWPWIVLIWIVAIPCFVALGIFYKICIEIGDDNSFSKKNAKSLKTISLLAICDSVFFFVVSMVFSIIWSSSLVVIITVLILVFIGIAIGVLSASLSHLVLNASEIKNENELTI